MRLFAIIFLSLILMMIPASAEVQYIEGYSLDGISKVTPTAGEVAAGVLHKFENNDVIIYIAEDSIRFTAKTDSGNAWVQYDFNNPLSVQPSINASEKSATWESIYNNVDVKYTLIPGGLKQEIIVYDTPPATKFRELITVSDGLTLEKQNGEWTFFKDGIRVFSLQKPYAVDANETEFNLDLTKTIEGSSLYLEIDASEALEDCVYPLVIDPTTYSGGYLSFWGSDVYDLPTLYSVTNNSSYISYDAPTTTYTFHVPVYQNSSSHVMSMDNATIHLKSIDDGSPAYIRWAGQLDYSDLNIFGYDTVALEFAPITDTTRASVYTDGGSGSVTDCNFSYLGYNALYQFGFTLNNCNNFTVTNYTSYKNRLGIGLYTHADYCTLTNCTCTDATVAGIYIYSTSNNNNLINCYGSALGTYYGIYFSGGYNNTLNNCTGISDSGYGIYLSNADDNTFNNCTGNSSSSYGIYVYAGSDGNEFNYCNGISDSNTATYVYNGANNNIFNYLDSASSSQRAVYVVNSNNTYISNSLFTTGGTTGVTLTGTVNTTIENSTSTGGSLRDYLIATSTKCTILDNYDDLYVTQMNDETSELYIINSDGQLFNETATATAYSYQNGTFQLYTTDQETFTITQYDSFLDSTTANSTVLGVPHTTSSINVTSGTLNSWISSGLTPDAYYELLTGGTTIDFIYADTGGNVTVSDDLTTGVYYLTPAVTYNVSGYVFDDGTPATAIEGATVNRAGVQSTTTNASGYYLLAVYNSTSTFTASANGYNYNQTDITVDGAPLTNQNFTLTAEQPNNVPLPIYLLTSIVALGGLFLTIPRRDDYGDEDVTLRNVIAGIISGGLAVTLSKVSINGQLVQTYAGVASTDVVVTGNSTIQIAYLGWFWIMIAIVAFMMTFYCVLKIVQYYADSELDMDFGDEYI